MRTLDLKVVEETPDDVSQRVKKRLGGGDDSSSFGATEIKDPRFELRSDIEDATIEKIHHHSS